MVVCTVQVIKYLKKTSEDKMKYRYIGKSGLRVSPICMGTMTFGSYSNKQEAFEILDYVYDKGINFYDTAEIYPIPPSHKYMGLTEEILGDWMQTKPRDSLIIASKVAGAANGWFVTPSRHGLTAIDSFHIKTAIEGSLKRLKTEYLDLYQVHWPDQLVPIEESLRAFEDLRREGKIRYIGTSNDTAYGLTNASIQAKYNKYQRFESIQNNFSLLEQSFFDSIQEVCEKEKISLLPYSPLAGGVLSGKYKSTTSYPHNARYKSYLQSNNKAIRKFGIKFVNENSLSATKKYIEVAKKYDISPITLSIAWTLQFDFVASSIIGATSVNQLDDALLAMDVKLSDEIMHDCDKVYKSFKQFILKY